jgi:hypothetical protein
MRGPFLNASETIHLAGKAGYLPRPYPALRSKCIVGCILSSVGLMITKLPNITYLPHSIDQTASLTTLLAHLL